MLGRIGDLNARNSRAQLSLLSNSSACEDRSVKMASCVVPAVLSGWPALSGGLWRSRERLSRERTVAGCTNEEIKRLWERGSRPAVFCETVGVSQCEAANQFEKLDIEHLRSQFISAMLNHIVIMWNNILCYVIVWNINRSLRVDTGWSLRISFLLSFNRVILHH